MQVRKEEKRDKREEKEKTEIKIIETERLEIDKRLNTPLLFSSKTELSIPQTCSYAKYA